MLINRGDTIPTDDGIPLGHDSKEDYDEDNPDQSEH